MELARAGAAVADDRQAEDLLAVAACRPRPADDDTEHLTQVADHGEPPCGRVAMMDIALAGMRRAVGIGQVLAQNLIGSRAQQQMAAQIAVQQRQHIAAGPQRQRHADRGGLVAGAEGNGAFDVSFLVQFQQPLLHVPGEEHQRIGNPIQGFSSQPMGPRASSAASWASPQGMGKIFGKPGLHPSAAGPIPSFESAAAASVPGLYKCNLTSLSDLPPGGPHSGVPDSSRASSACHGQVDEIRVTAVSSGGSGLKLYPKGSSWQG